MILHKYSNGNAEVTLFEDGTRHVEFEGELKLDFPLNIDIRVNHGCSLGYDPQSKKAVCAFCHESARTDGKECDYEELKKQLCNLPAGTELAIGGNKITQELEEFCYWCSFTYVCNLTVNSLHLEEGSEHVSRLRNMILNGFIKGLGISWRKDCKLPPEDMLNYPNTVLHVIAGIDDPDEIAATPFKKVLVLGYKQFGFGKAYYSPEVEENLKKWRQRIPVLFEKEVCSFDNLALEQLDVKRFLSQKNWDSFYQGEHSFYIDAVGKFFAPSSRSAKRTPWGETTVKSYFRQLEDNDEKNPKDSPRAG